MASVLRLWKLPRISVTYAACMWRRDALLYRRSWTRNILPNFFEPLLYLLSIGFGLGLYVGQKILGVDYVLFIAPGLAAASAMNGVIFELTYNVFVKLHFAHLYDAVVTTPLEPEDITFGELLWGLTRSLIYGCTFLIVMIILGDVRSPLTIFAPFAFILIGTAMGEISLVFVSIIPRLDYMSFYWTLFITPLFLFSGIFFPLSNLPAVARVVAWFTPLEHGVALVRALTLTGDVKTALFEALWLIVFSAILLPPAINLMRRRLIT